MRVTDNLETKPKSLSRYRKVEVRTWGDAKFRALSPIPPCGQGLFLYLITGPHTGPIPGLFRAGRAAMAEELGWELEAFDKAFREALNEGMVEADFKARVMWVPKAIRHNKPESPNVVRGWASEFDLIPECALKWVAAEALKANIHALGEPYRKAFDEAIGKTMVKASVKPSGKTMPNQEQEQEQDIKDPLTPKGGKRAVRQRGDVDPVGFREFWSVYPRKTDRLDAVKAFRAINPDAELLQKILAGLAKWIVYDRWVKDGGKYIKNPGPWLRGRLWEDEEVCGSRTVAPRTTPQWVTSAGFSCIEEADNFRCNAANFRNFRDGKRIAADEAVPA